MDLFELPDIFYGELYDDIIYGGSIETELAQVDVLLDELTKNVDQLDNDHEILSLVIPLDRNFRLQLSKALKTIFL